MNRNIKQTSSKLFYEGSTGGVQGRDGGLKFSVKPGEVQPRDGGLKTGLLALEPRILLDAAGAATVADLAAEQFAQDQLNAHADAGSAHSAPASELTAEQESLIDALAIAPTQSRREIAFVDTSVADYQSIIAELDADANGVNLEVILLDGSKDGVEQMLAALAGWGDQEQQGQQNQKLQRSEQNQQAPQARPGQASQQVQQRQPIAALHIISHGDAGSLRLGATTLDQAAITGAYAGQLAALGAALSDTADILVYGCNFGHGTIGSNAVAALAAATGADIAASDDRTGAAGQGGDWELEQAAGPIESRTLQATDYTGVLTTEPTLTATPANPIFTSENSSGDAVTLFSGADVDPGETDQT